MGKTLVRRVLTGEQGTPKKGDRFSRDEAKQHDMRMSYLNREPPRRSDLSKLHEGPRIQDRRCAGFMRACALP